MDNFDIEKRRYYALMIVGIALPLLLLPFLSMLFLSTDQSTAYRLICSRFLIWAVFGLMLLYARYGEVQRFMLWDDERYDIGVLIGFVILLFLLIFIAGIVAHIPFYFGLREKNEAGHKMQQVMDRYPMVMIFTVATAGITEELIFRGYMIPRLSLFFKNKNIPVFISAALFSFIHLGYKNVAELIFTLLFGLIVGFHYQKFRNIHVLIIVHFLWDLMACMVGHGR